MPLRIGIIGAGANTRLRHIPGFQAIDGVSITAVCNRTYASGQAAAKAFNIPTVFDDWHELVLSDQVDAVCIGTWPYLHCPITLACVDAGKHVLTEARMCMNLAEARRMYDASCQSDKVTMIVPGGSYMEPEPLLLDMIEDDFFGDFLEIHIRGMSGSYNPQAPLHWRQRRDLSGQNIMALGILNEAVRRYAGDEIAVMAQAQTFTPQRLDTTSSTMRQVDVPESLGAIATMASGATAVYHLSSVCRHGTAGAFEFHGTKGAIKLENNIAWIAGVHDTAFRKLEIDPAQRGGWRVEADFIDAIRKGKPVTHTSFADGLKYMTFTEAVQLSLQQGRRIEWPLD